jgi:serine/threonine-protein kinase
MGRAFLLKGQPETALDLFEQEADEWRGLLGKVMAYHTMGQPKASDAALYELIQKFGHQRAFFIAGAMAYRNEPDRAFEWLERAVDNHEPDWYIVAEPLLANIREDPRWLPFVESINRSPAELDAIDFEIPLPN